MLALAAVGPQVDAGQRADGAAEADHDVAAPARGQRPRASRADRRRGAPGARAASGGSWRRNRRVVRTAPRGRLAMETTRPRRTRLSCRLAPPRSATTPSLERAGSRGPRRRPAALRRARSGSRTSMPSSGAGAGRGGARGSRASRTAEVATATMRGPRPSEAMAREEAVHGPERSVDRVTGQRAGRAIAQPRGHALLRRGLDSRRRARSGREGGGRPSIRDRRLPPGAASDDLGRSVVPSRDHRTQDRGHGLKLVDGRGADYWTLVQSVQDGPWTGRQH